MSLFDALMNLKNQGRLDSFDMLDDKKAKVRLSLQPRQSVISGKSVANFIVYMSDDYIIGSAMIAEAYQAPAARFVVYNNWDKVGEDAFNEAKRLDIEIYKFGDFGRRLDQLKFIT